MPRRQVLQASFRRGTAHLHELGPRHRTTAVRRTAGGLAVQLSARLTLGSGGQPMPASTRARMESAFGEPFADVRVHVGPEASSLGALAFTAGSHVYFAPGHYNPESPAGQRLLGHELAHVLQQRRGRVPHPFRSGLAIIQDSALEAEAERMGHIAASHVPASTSIGSRVRPSLQMKAKRGALQLSIAKALSASGGVAPPKLPPGPEILTAELGTTNRSEIREGIEGMLPKMAVQMAIEMHKLFRLGEPMTKGNAERDPKVKRVRQLLASWNAGAVSYFMNLGYMIFQLDPRKVEEDEEFLPPRWGQQAQTMVKELRFARSLLSRGVVLNRSILAAQSRTFGARFGAPGESISGHDNNFAQLWMGNPTNPRPPNAVLSASQARRTLTNDLMQFRQSVPIRRLRERLEQAAELEAKTHKPSGKSKGSD